MSKPEVVPVRGANLLAGGAPKRPRRRRSKGKPTPQWETIEVAAAKLDLDPQALRARCRRAARKQGTEIVATLGMGVVARKLGTSWRVYVPAAPVEPDEPT
jgi:hypothetical protein